MLHQAQFMEIAKKFPSKETDKLKQKIFMQFPKN